MLKQWLRYWFKFIYFFAFIIKTDLFMYGKFLFRYVYRILGGHLHMFGDLRTLLLLFNKWLIETISQQH